MRITLVSGAVTNLVCLMTVKTAILTSIMANFVAIQWRGPTPNGK